MEPLPLRNGTPLQERVMSSVAAFSAEIRRLIVCHLNFFSLLFDWNWNFLFLVFLLVFTFLLSAGFYTFLIDEPLSDFTRHTESLCVCRSMSLIVKISQHASDRKQ